MHLHPALQGFRWRFPKDLVNIVRVQRGAGLEGPFTW